MAMAKPGELHAISASRLFDGAVLRGPAALLHRDGKIVGVAEPGDVPAGALRHDLGPGALLAPGFIDAQVNGGGGVLLNDQPTPDGMRAIIAAHRRFGTTGLLPTLITDNRETMQRAVAAAHEMKGQPGFLGLHLEGPFLNPERKGVHRPEFMVAPTDADLDLLGQAALVTLAPERVAPGFIRALRQRGPRIAAGHTMATAAQMIAAVEEGLTGITHLFNAMPPLSGRAPGPIGAAFADERLVAGIICDGLHVDPVNVRAAWRAMGAARLMLVTDAMPSVGAATAAFNLLGRDVTLADGRLVLGDGTLAGAHLDMAAAVRNAVNLAGIPLTDALAMASATPAAFLGQTGQRGRLAPGLAADLVALDAGFGVFGTWVAGEYMPS